MRDRRLPTAFAGRCSLGFLWVRFLRSLATPLVSRDEDREIDEMKTIAFLAGGTLLLAVNGASAQPQPASPAPPGGASAPCPMAAGGMSGSMMGAAIGQGGMGNMQQMHEDMQAMQGQMAAMHSEMQAMHQDMMKMHQAMGVQAPMRGQEPPSDQDHPN